MNDRIAAALSFVNREFSVSRHEAQREFGPMLLSGLLSHGYAIERGERIAVTDAGRRALADLEKGKEESVA